MRFERILTAAAVASVCAAPAAAAENAADRDWSGIYFASTPCVSPDGSFIVFGWNDRIWRAGIEGGEAVPLGDPSASASRPVISPDGKRVAFLSNRWGPEQLFEIEFAPGGTAVSSERQITFHTESLTPWAYSHDGSAVLATGRRDGAPGVDPVRASFPFARTFLVPVASRGAEIPLFDAPAFAPSVSPDGTRILFTSGLESRGLERRKRHDWSKTSYKGSIWLYDVKAGTFRPVVEKSDSAAAALWAPDGKNFYYLCNAGGVRNIYRRSLETGEERQITFFDDDHVFLPSISRDGRTMVFCKGFDVWRIDPEAEKPVPAPIPLKPAGFDPSSGRVLRRAYDSCYNNYGEGSCTFRDGGSEAAFTAGGDVWAVLLDEDKKATALVHGSSRTHERDCVFAPGGDALYYLSDRGDGTDVWRAKRADASKPWSSNLSFERERLTSDDACRRGLSVSPDGSRIAWHDLQGRIVFADTNAVPQSVSSVPSCSCGGYAWSPDGRRVAAAFVDGFGNSDVWIVPADGSPPCNISRNWKWDGSPAWSPDGRIVAFSGRRTGGGPSRIFYAYLDPADENAESNGGEARKDPCNPDFATLHERVRDTGVKGEYLSFMPDSRTLSFSDGGKVMSMKIPSKKPPERVCDKFGSTPSAWVKDGKSYIPLRMVGMRPARGDKVFSFNVYQTTDAADYRELAFLSAWAYVRDGFCDPECHGADWAPVRGKYLLAARNAPSWSVFSRTIQAMLGELDASHLGFYLNDAARKQWVAPAPDAGWRIFTVHIGARFDPAREGEGWLVKDVIPRSDADRGDGGILPGDLVLSIDGRKVRGGMDYAEIMNGPLPHKYVLSIRRGESEIVREVSGFTFDEARRLLRDATAERARRYVAGRGNFGYLAVGKMGTEDADRFADGVFAECFGRDGVVIDVRGNTGGRTADRLIDMLCGNRHARTLSRGAEKEGYLLDRYARPVVTTLPAVVLADERTQSNGEEFAHAMQSLGRAKVVGVETAGDVIGTVDLPLFDMGVMRRPKTAFFLPDGRDMEGNGAKPDVEVSVSPSDIASGRDPQLEAAVATLAADVAARPAPPPLKFAGRDEANQ